MPSQWRCAECGAIRAIPHTFHIRGTPIGGYLDSVSGKPCKRCGSKSEATCDFDPWLDIADEDEGPPIPASIGEG